MTLRPYWDQVRHEEDSALALSLARALEAVALAAMLGLGVHSAIVEQIARLRRIAPDAVFGIDHGRVVASFPARGMVG